MDRDPDPATPPAPGDCADAVPSGEILALPQPSLDDTRRQLPLMQELQHDTKLLWQEFGIQPDHMMVDGLPRMLVQVDDAGGRCDQILDAVDRSDLVIFVRWTEEDYSAAFDRGLPPWRQLIKADIGADNDDAPLWTSIGTGRYGVTSVTLRADQEELAATLLDRYDELIELSVGNFAFPPERIEPGARSWCQTLPEGDLPTTITIRAMTLRGAATTGDVEVVLSNDSATTVHLVPSRIAELTTPGSTRLVSAFTEAMSAEERESLRLEPGAEITITAVASTASCNVDVGYSLPAGAYEFVLPIYVFDSPAWESDVSDRVLLPRLEVELQ